MSIYFNRLADHHRGDSVTRIIEIIQGSIEYSTVNDPLCELLIEQFGSYQAYAFIQNIEEFREDIDLRHGEVIRRFLTNWDFEYGTAELPPLYEAIGAWTAWYTTNGSEHLPHGGDTEGGIRMERVVQAPYNRILAHWKFTEVELESLGDTVEEEKDKLLVHFQALNEGDKHDVYKAYLYKQEIFAPPAEAPEEVAPPTLTRAGTVEPLMAGGNVSFGTSSRQADTLRSTMSSIRSYEDEVTLYNSRMPKVILEALAEQVRNRSANVLEGIGNQILRQIELEATVGFHKQIAAINEDPNSKWYIIRNGRYFYATTKEHIMVQGAVHDEDGSLVVDDSEFNRFNYGFVQVKFTHNMIKRIYIGGVATMFARVGRSVHPHLNAIGESRMCAGNLSGHIINTMRGKTQEVLAEYGSTVRGSEAEAMTNAGSVIAETVLQKMNMDDLASSEGDLSPLAPMIQELSVCYTINDLQSYLAYTYSLMCSDVDYGSPYIYLDENSLDEMAENYRTRGDNGDRYSPYGCFDELLDDKKGSWPYNTYAIQQGLELGHIKMETLDTLIESRHVCSSQIANYKELKEGEEARRIAEVLND